MLAERARWLGERIASARVPVIPVGHTCVNLSRYGRDLLGGAASTCWPASTSA